MNETVTKISDVIVPEIFTPYVIEKTAEMIKNIVREAETGKIYTGKVVKVEDFGCFVELWPGCEGFIHVSNLSDERVKHPSDVVKTGDILVAKAIEYDRKGKINLSLRTSNKPKVDKENNKKDKEEKDN